MELGVVELGFVATLGGAPRRMAMARTPKRMISGCLDTRKFASSGFSCGKGAGILVY